MDIRVSMNTFKRVFFFVPCVGAVRGLYMFPHLLAVVVVIVVLMPI